MGIDVLCPGRGAGDGDLQETHLLKKDIRCVSGTTEGGYRGARHCVVPSVQIRGKNSEEDYSRSPLSAV